MKKDDEKKTFITMEMDFKKLEERAVATIIKGNPDIKNFLIDKDRELSGKVLFNRDYYISEDPIPKEVKEKFFKEHGVLVDRCDYRVIAALPERLKNKK